MANHLVYPRLVLLVANSGTLRTLYVDHNHKHLQTRIHPSLLVLIHYFAMSTSAQHEDDGAHDFYNAYDLSMSEMSNTNADE